MNEEITFTKDDFDSPTWKKLERLWANKMESTRCRNERMIPVDETNFVRGRISVYRELLAIKEQSR